MARLGRKTVLVVQLFRDMMEESDWGGMEQQLRKGSDTRDRILDAAEAAVLAKGFAGTSIDELIAAVGITKSGFFYDFRDRGELALALLIR